MEESTASDSSDGSVQSSISRVSLRPRKTSTCKESNESSEVSETEKRLKELLGSESNDSDQDYVPSPKKQKRANSREQVKSPARTGESGVGSSVEGDSRTPARRRRPSSCSITERVARKRKRRRQQKSLPTDSEEEEDSRISVNLGKRGTLSIAGWFLHPSFLKAVQGEEGGIRASLTTTREERPKQKIAYRLREFLAGCEETVQLLLSSGSTDQLCTLTGRLLASSRSMLIKRAEMGGPLLNDLLGGLAVDTLTPHITGLRLLCDSIKQVGEMASGWVFAQKTVERCGHELLRRGALRHLSEMLASYKSLPKTVGREDGIRLLRHSVEMMEEVVSMGAVDALSESIVSSRSATHTDTLIQDMSEIMSRLPMSATYPVLGIFTWHLLEMKGLQTAIDMLTEYCDRHSDHMIVHLTLLYFLRDQAADQDLILQTLLNTSKSFPHHSCVVEYCSLLLQPDQEDLDKTLDSESDLDPSDKPSPSIATHHEVVHRLLIYLDCQSNAATTKAWDLLAGSLRVLLLAGEQGRQAVEAEMSADRRSWWFEHHVLLVKDEREPRCIAKQLTVYDFLIGPSHPLSRRLEDCLQAAGSGNSTAALLAERRAFAVREAALFPKMQPANTPCVRDTSTADIEANIMQEEWVQVEELRTKPRPWFYFLPAGSAVGQQQHVADSSPSQLSPRNDAYSFLKNFLYVELEEQKELVQRYFSHYYLLDQTAAAPKNWRYLAETNRKRILASFERHRQLCPDMEDLPSFVSKLVAGVQSSISTTACLTRCLADSGLHLEVKESRCLVYKQIRSMKQYLDWSRLEAALKDTTLPQTVANLPPKLIARFRQQLWQHIRKKMSIRVGQETCIEYQELHKPQLKLYSDHLLRDFLQ